ncbi:hypothetical protein [Piscinibacter sp.]|uniref:hypothetical protein n=1 Tax=Piscinibacter sp. TaxID=1903157 RepID=UPI002C595629|nr:hypothetical protein [Albitalea sp.]HUG26089.1 hypothetical protein [Albitalea sp.]
MQRTRLALFGLLNGFGVEALHSFGAQPAQGRIGRELDRRPREPLAGSLSTGHFALQRIYDQLPQRGAALDRLDLGAPNDVIGKV